MQKVDEQNEASIIKRATAKLKRGEDAKIVFSGKIFQVWQWSQKLYDGSETIFESLSRPDTVTILAFDEENRVIVTRQSQPGLEEFMSLPGGIIDAPESVLSAGKRELLEETGYVSRDWYFLFSNQMSGKIDWVNFCLVAKNCELVAEKNLDPGEKISLEFFDLDSFGELIKREDFRDKDFAMWWLRNEEKTELL